MKAKQNGKEYGTPGNQVRLLGLVFGFFVIIRSVTSTESTRSMPEHETFKLNLETVFKNILTPLIDFTRVKGVKIPKRDDNIANWLASLFPTNQRREKMWNNCDRDMKAFQKSIPELWMLRVLDSLGKPSSGISRWNIFWPGDYDQCLDTQINLTSIFTSGVKTKYCLMKLEMSDNFTFESGICVPSTCDSKTIEFYNDVFKSIIVKIPILGAKIDGESKFSYECFDYDDRILDTKAIICLSILSSLVLVSLLATSYDSYSDSEIVNHDDTYVKIDGKNIQMVPSAHKTPQSEERQEIYDVNEQPINEKEKTQIRAFTDYVLCFSIWRNTRDILSVDKSPCHFPCIDGLRVISLAWVVLSQSYFYLAYGAYAANPRDILAYSQSWYAQIILRGDNAADTFLVISGFLLTYWYLKNDATDSVWRVLKMYLHRYFRITPTYYLTVFAYVCLFPYLGDGPYWRTIVTSVQKCRDNWFYNLLFINNFQADASRSICIRPSWYLSLEMQCLLISPFFLILLKCKRKYLGLAMITILLITSWMVTWLISYGNELNISGYGLKEPFNLTLVRKREDDVFDKVLILPHTRISAFLIGSSLGFFVERLDGTKDFLPKWLVVITWILSVALNLSITFGLSGTELGSEAKASFNALSRTIWSVTVSWLILACVTNHAGPVNRILSWPVWIPLARMTYGAFLGHTLVLELFYGSARTPTYYTSCHMVIHYLGYLSLCFGIGFVLSVFIEIPVSKIEKLIGVPKNE